MNFDLEKLQAAAELGEVIRLQNQALDQLESFRKVRPNLIVPNLARMVEENLKENVQILYKELNNLHKPQAEQRRHICRLCKMAFAVSLPGGICDECRSKQTVSPAPAYGVRPSASEERSSEEESPVVEEETAMSDEETVTRDETPSPDLTAASDSEASERSTADNMAQNDESETESETPVDESQDEDAPVEEPPSEDQSGSEPEIKEPPSEGKSEQRS